MDNNKQIKERQSKSKIKNENENTQIIRVGIINQHEQVEVGHEDKNNYTVQRYSKNILMKQNSIKQCQFYYKGICKFGMECRNLHSDIQTNQTFQKNNTFKQNQIENDDIFGQIKNEKQYKFDDKLVEECKKLSKLVIEEKIKGYDINLQEQQKLMQEINEFEEIEIGDKSKFNMVLIRHAMSEANYILSKYTTGKSKRILKLFKQHFRYFLYQGNSLFLDAPLHPIGIEQCIQNRNKNNEIQYQIIFVSPLRRTMQTCIELFKTHPLRHKIEFVVYPEIAEALKKDSDIFNIEEFEELIKKAKIYQIIFNTESYFNSDWQFKQLQNCYKCLSDQVSISTKTIQQLCEKVFPQSLENFSNFQKRIFRAFNYVQQIQRQTNNLIGVITHSLVIKEFLNSQNSQSEELIENLTFIYHQNQSN